MLYADDQTAFQLNDYLDISPPVSANIAVFPGDVAFRRQIQCDFAEGGHLGLSSIETTLHVGAHADAPNHYHADGASIEKRSLLPYIGLCQVVRARAPAGARVELSHLNARPACERVLIRTDSFPDPNTWNSDFCSLSPTLVDSLAAAGTRLVGIDTPSVDPETSKALETHQALYRNDLAVLEGLVLRHVEPGHYFLIAPPLSIVGGDASPVRAVLFQLREGSDGH